RAVRVPDRKAKATTAARPKAETGNPSHIGAPMPGVVASVDAPTVAGNGRRASRCAHIHRRSTRKR
ncbi:hypothetical protein, partial [Salipiger thiooxidans]|uniref:hypothetical protein n=1 Tax=Salipiger thiooxidans TaxID=282683 RepID=UPI001CD5E104